MFGISKQAYYQRISSQKEKDRINKMIIEQVAIIRKKMPMTGTRKLHHYLKSFLEENNIKMGRDALLDVLRSHGLLVKRTKRYHITTDSKHFFFKSPNHVKNVEIMHAEQVFVSDITYIKVIPAHAYLSLVTDAYSKKIMGWSLDDNMKVSMVKQALKMANKNRIHKHESVIHHSDRGIQYCCPDYSTFAQDMGFVLSTTQQYDPYENAIAERINGILKYEFGLRKDLVNIDLARKMIAQAVQIYNNERIHWSLDLKTPDQVHQQYNKQKYKSYAKKVA